MYLSKSDLVFKNGEHERAKIKHAKLKGTGYS